MAFYSVSFIAAETSYNIRDELSYSETGQGLINEMTTAGKERKYYQETLPVYKKRLVLVLIPTSKNN